MYYFPVDGQNGFPPLDYADDAGIIAVGGDLSIERLLLAYSSGIFPWYNEGEPIIWWSPDPRFVLYPENLRISKSMKKVLRDEKFQITMDTSFEEVVRSCQKIKREGQNGTWITEEMLQAYVDLHQAGFAHSVEVWEDKILVGGLYGVSLGRCFFGESMFAKVSNASKTGFITLVKELHNRGFKMIDCQVHTQHLESLGAVSIPRSNFEKELRDHLQHPTLRGSWRSML